MTSWILTFALVTMVNGRPAEQEHVVTKMSGPEQCLVVLRAMQRTLPRGTRIHRPQCQEAWMT